MLIWLDADTSHRDDPNQNFARELMERFTMGVGNYTQEDVVQSARCFHGVGARQRLGGVLLQPLRQRQRGQKVPRPHRAVHGRGHRQHRLQRARFAPLGDLPAVVLVGVPDHAERPDRAGLRPRLLQGPQHHQPACRNVQPSCLRLAESRERPGQAARRTVGRSAARSRPDDGAIFPGQLAGQLGNIGQVLFTPPTVGGWGSNQYWQSTGAAAGYIQQAYSLAGVANLTALENGDGHPAAQVTAALSLIGLPKVSDRTHAALISLAESLKTNNGSWPAQQLVTLALLSPEFAMN